MGKLSDLASSIFGENKGDRPVRNAGEIILDLNKVEFPDTAAEDFKTAREQRKAELSIQGVNDENVKRLVPDQEWDQVRVSITLLQNAVEALFNRKYMSPERHIVVLGPAIREMKAMLFRKMKKDGKFSVTEPELELLVEALNQDLQAMDGFSYVEEYIKKEAATNLPEDKLHALDKKVLAAVVESKAKRGECKNETCTNKRRSDSAYCQDCSDAHKAQEEKEKAAQA